MTLHRYIIIKLYTDNKKEVKFEEPEEEKSYTERVQVKNNIFSLEMKQVGRTNK